MINHCTCEHDYQDKKYGKNKRVWNPTMKGARCTVCGASISDDKKKENKNKQKGK